MRASVLGGWPSEELAGRLNRFLFLKPFSEALVSASSLSFFGMACNTCFLERDFFLPVSRWLNRRISSASEASLAARFGDARVRAARKA